MRVLILVVLVSQFCSAQADKPKFNIPAPIPEHEDKFVRTAQMRIYSDAYFIEEEAGDVLGYELAIRQNNGSAVDALLYFYQGAPNNRGIQLSGRISGKKLSLAGNWVEHLIQYPSRKKIIETHFVRIDGMLTSTRFRGRIDIQGYDTEIVRLRRVDCIWLCKQ